MAPSSAATPARASSRKRTAPAKFGAYPDQDAATNKRPRSRTLSVKKKPPKQQKAARTQRKKKEVVEKPVEDDDVCADEPDAEELALAEEEELATLGVQEQEQEVTLQAAARRRVAQPTRAAGDKEPEFVGEPIPADDARSRWPKRYQQTGTPARKDEEEDLKARCHYNSAMLDEIVYVKAGENEDDYIGRITELFEGTDMCKYFTCRWFFRPEDTLISKAKFPDDHKHDAKRVFLSEDKNDNALDCLIAKVKIIHVDPNAEFVADTELYYDMSYTVAYSAFANIPSDNENSGISSDADSETDTTLRTGALLDLYSGCGGMSTGLCLGTALAGVKLETKWAVDLNSYACKSMKCNHPLTEVRNEKAEEFLALLKEWTVLCNTYVHSNDSDAASPVEDDGEDNEPRGEDEFVVENLLEICYGGPGRENGIYFKVRWEGHGPKEDTWEPIENLRLVPNYAMRFMKGRSSKPFGRLWWDETVPTVVTRAEPHNQIILHPSQPRVLSVRENARLQGFPDYYRMNGPIKEKYIQVGNAVAVPVARALGYALGRAYLGDQLEGRGDPLFVLPESFTYVMRTEGPSSVAGELVEH